MFFDQYNVQPGSSDPVGPTDPAESVEPAAGVAGPAAVAPATGLAGPGWPAAIPGLAEAGGKADSTGPDRPAEFVGLIDPTDAAGSTAATTATEELITAAGPAESSAPEAPVSFIRESWLQPPVWIPATGSKTRATGTRPLPVAFGQESGRADGWPRRTVMAVGTVLVGLIAILAFVSVHNGQVAAKWQQRDAAQVALTQQVSAQLEKANQHITTLDGTVGSLQGQLATATSKQKGNSGVSGVLHRLIWPFG